MLYRQEYTQEAADILNESVHLTEEESIMNVTTIPIIENSRIGANVIRFSSLEKFSEDNCLSYIDAMQTIAESHNINLNTLAVDIPEWKIIEDPELVNEVANVIVSPISHSNPVFQFVETCVDATMETGDETFMEEVENVLLELSDETIKRAADKRHDQILDYYDKINAIGRDFRTHRGNILDERRANIATLNLTRKLNKTLAKSHRIFKHAARISDDDEDPGLYEVDQDGKPIIDPKTGKARIRRRGDEYRLLSKEGAPKNIDKFLVKLKVMKSKITKKTPVKYIVQAIASLKKKYKEFKEKIENTPPEQRSLIQRICYTIMNLIDRFNKFMTPDPEEEEKKALDRVYANRRMYGY